MTGEDGAQPVRPARQRRLCDAEEAPPEVAEPGTQEPIQHGHDLHDRLARAAGLRRDDEARARERQGVEHGVEGAGVEVVEEMKPRPRPERGQPRNAVTRELSDRLAAETGAARAEEHHVAGPLEQPRHRRPDLREIVGARGKPQERQRAVGMGLTQAVETAFDAGERIGVSARRKALRPIRSSRQVSMD